jgi:hypothetical protein
MKTRTIDRSELDLDSVAQAFDDQGDSESHVKTMVDTTAA